MRRMVNIYSARRHKFGVAPKADRTYNGIAYASLAEGRRAAMLDTLKRGGIIRDWSRQPRYELGTLYNVYVADFLVTDPDGTQHVEDVKGFQTRKFKNDLRLWRVFGPLPLWIVRPTGRTTWGLEIIHPEPKGVKT